jgi:hypothetical protein
MTIKKAGRRRPALKYQERMPRKVIFIALHNVLRKCEFAGANRNLERGGLAGRCDRAALSREGLQLLERRLTAILAADVVGYSRLMGANEVGTLQSLEQHQKELIEPEVANRQGRIVKLTVTASWLHS